MSVIPLLRSSFLLKVGNVRRSLRFPDGALCEMFGDAGLDQLLGRSDHLLQRVLNGWERNLSLALLALVLTIAAVVGFIKFGVPLIAKQVVNVIPYASEARLGKDSLAFLDKFLMEPSKLPADRRRQVTALFQGMKSRLTQAEDYRLEFRSSDEIGANAFALPGGTIVVTDRMVELAGNDEELAGVLAHESGHIRARHSLRHVLQSTGSGLLIAAVTGDITSITSLSATLPTTLVNAGYSREFENEADDAAVAYLLKTGIKPKIYAQMLAKLQVEQDKDQHQQEKSRFWTPADLFASHPSTLERIKRIP